MPTSVGFPARTASLMRRQRTNQENDRPKIPHTQSAVSMAGTGAKVGFAAAGIETSAIENGSVTSSITALKLGYTGAALLCHWVCHGT
jgi:hypothetical protein